MRPTVHLSPQAAALTPAQRARVEARLNADRKGKRSHVCRANCPCRASHPAPVVVARLGRDSSEPPMPKGTRERTVTVRGCEEILAIRDPGPCSLAGEDHAPIPMPPEARVSVIPAGAVYKGRDKQGRPVLKPARLTTDKNGHVLAPRVTMDDTPTGLAAREVGPYVRKAGKRGIIGTIR